MISLFEPEPRSGILTLLERTDISRSDDTCSTCKLLQDIPITLAAYAAFPEDYVGDIRTLAEKVYTRRPLSNLPYILEPRERSPASVAYYHPHENEVLNRPPPLHAVPLEECSAPPKPITLTVENEMLEFEQVLVGYEGMVVKLFQPSRVLEVGPGCSSCHSSCAGCHAASSTQEEGPCGEEECVSCKPGFHLVSVDGGDTVGRCEAKEGRAPSSLDGILYTDLVAEMFTSHSLMTKDEDTSALMRLHFNISTMCGNTVVRQIPWGFDEGSKNPVLVHLWYQEAEHFKSVSCSGRLSVQEEEQVLSIDQLFSINFYHFTVQNLWKILVARDMMEANPRLKLLTYNTRHIRAFAQILELPADRVIKYNPCRLYHVQQLTVLPFTPQTPLSSPLLQFVRREMKEVLTEAKLPLSSFLDVSGKPLLLVTSRRLERQESSNKFVRQRRVVTNTDEVLRVATETFPNYQVVEVDGTLFTLPQQIRLFQKAAVVIGPDGAALANAVYMHSNSTMLVLQPLTQDDGCHCGRGFFWEIADAVNLHIRSLILRNVGNLVPFEVPLQVLHNFLLNATAELDL